MSLKLHFRSEEHDKTISLSYIKYGKKIQREMGL